MHITSEKVKIRYIFEIYYQHFTCTCFERLKPKFYNVMWIVGNQSNTIDKNQYSMHLVFIFIGKEILCQHCNSCQVELNTRTSSYTRHLRLAKPITVAIMNIGSEKKLLLFLYGINLQIYGRCRFIHYPASV